MGHVQGPYIWRKRQQLSQCRRTPVSRPGFEPLIPVLGRFRIFDFETHAARPLWSSSYFQFLLKNYYCISGILVVVRFRPVLLYRFLAANSEIKITQNLSLSFVVDGFKTHSYSRGYNGRQSEGKNWWRAYTRMRDKDGARALEFNYCLFFT
jgi:hypothetical protein